MHAFAYILREPVKLNKEELKIMDLIKKQEEKFIVENIVYANKFNSRYYEYLIIKENNIHNRIMKDKEIELIKAQTELELIKSNQIKTNDNKKSQKPNITKL